MINVISQHGQYSIHLKKNFLHDPRVTLCIADEKFRGQIPVPTFFVQAHEENKSLKTCQAIFDFFQRHRLTKEQWVLGMGGGLIHDITSFACALYMRGVPWLFMPTTTLCAMDACLGGKNAVNVDGIKNLIGTYYPPREIAIDLTFFRQLSAMHFRNGFFEAAKTCAVGGLASFEQYLAYYEQNDLESVIRLSLTCKKEIVERDEFDTGKRLLLNFGHTFGHAFETVTNFELPHGFAVGLGMLVVLEKSPDSQLKSLMIPHIEILLSGYEEIWQPLYIKFQTEGEFRAEIFSIMQKDKKATKEGIRFIYPTQDSVMTCNFLREL